VTVTFASLRLIAAVRGLLASAIASAAAAVPGTDTRASALAELDGILRKL
jgi:hypothetical protein